MNPVAYPPVFYLVEAGMYGLFGVGAGAAKATGHLFLIVGAMYTLAWHRHWLGADAGWLAPLFVLTPGVARWSNAVMLNAPATMLAIASLYHMHRWLDDLDQAKEKGQASASSCQMLLAAGLGVLAILTYLPAGYLLFVMIAGLLARRHWRVFLQPRVILTAIICATPIVAWLLLTSEYAPRHMTWVTPRSNQLAQTSHYLYYAKSLPSLVAPWLLTLPVIGTIIGLSWRRWRKETALLLGWVIIAYAAFTFLETREPRYAMPLFMPIAALGAVAVIALRDLARAAARRHRTRIRNASMAMVAGLLVWGAIDIRNVPTHRIEGVREAA